MTLLTLPNYRDLRVLVYGDIMLDRYCYGQVSRISPEAPVPVVSVGQTEARLGGAANVAFNVSRLGANSLLLGALGDDEEGKIMLSLLAEQDIHYPCSPFPDYTTVTKLRILSQNQQLLRLDFEKYLSAVERSMLTTAYKESCRDIDVVILSDYNKGALLDNVPALIRAAKEQDIPVWVDPKASDLSRYTGATVLTPNFKEFSTVVGCCVNQADMIEKARQVIQQHDLEALLITQGSEGLTLIEKAQEAVYFPASGYEVYDVTGAGDTVMAVMSASVAAGVSMADAAELANRAAGMVVSKLGVSAVSALDLQHALPESKQPTSKIMQKQDLLFF